MEMSANMLDPADAEYHQALLLHQQGLLADARASYERVLQRRPQHAATMNMLGVMALQTNQPARAVELIGAAILIDPKNPLAYINIGSAYSQLNDHEAAIGSFDCAIALKSEFDAVALFNRGNGFHKLKRYQDAVASYDQAIALKSGCDAEIHYSRGVALNELRQYRAAIASFDDAIALGTGFAAEAHYCRGVAQLELRQFQDAVASLDQAMALKPGYQSAELWNHRGVALAELNQYDAAIASFDRALALRPEHAHAYNNRGVALSKLDRHQEAVVSFDKAIGLMPGQADAHRNRGVSLLALKRYEAAIVSFRSALTLSPALPGLHGTHLGARTQICDWDDLESELAELNERIKRAEAASPPFILLALSGSAPLRRTAAETWAQTTCPLNRALPALSLRAVSGKIRVGYFSADFNDHPVMHLAAGMFEKHDRAQFELTAFSFGADSQDSMKQRLMAAFDRFIDVRGHSDQEVALLARDLKIDVAVDLTGFTHKCRPGIFALRSAPLQVSYLGYPGTMGVAYMDYLIADRTLIPEASQRHYVEKIIYLPHSYQVNDSTRCIADTVLSREDLQLPTAGFVFCCFNNSFKINPETFEVWMRILKRVDGSVLWLLGENPGAIGNLRREAAQRGVNPERLVFAGRVRMAEHLARHRHADLVLDTLPYNAHTTASDALWAGVPVLTCTGQAFASRVAASLLKAMDVPELVTSTRTEYEDLAIELAHDPQRMRRLKQRLANGRISAPLFDTGLSTRHIEAAYRIIFERYQAQLRPEHIDVPSGG